MPFLDGRSDVYFALCSFYVKSNEILNFPLLNGTSCVCLRYGSQEKLAVRIRGVYSAEYMPRYGTRNPRTHPRRHTRSTAERTSGQRHSPVSEVVASMSRCTSIVVLEEGQTD